MIKCIIIEDEPVARDILKKYIADIPTVELVGEFEEAVSALAFLRNNLVELIFLDINMPKLSGISFLKSLSSPPDVILTTAYSEYALESYELDVVDYLLKPFSFERFLKAVNKINTPDKSINLENKSISIKADGKLYRINVEDIILAESMGDYITLHTTSQKLTFNQTLTSFIKEVSSNTFTRVHRSYSVNLAKIDFVEGNIINLDGHQVPIGKSYREEFRKKI
jgi:DNA-binding LytR/AlgR family response regulator